MDKAILEEKWKMIEVDGPGYRSLRMDGVCIPELYIGVHDASTRCLILKLPGDFDLDFQPAEKANLSIEFYPESRWVILKLLDNSFTDLFDDLILSIYNKIGQLPDVHEYSAELITIFYKWSEFFNDTSRFRLPEETIRGIFGELVVLKEYLSGTQSSGLNDLLESWRGPYNHRHDFSFGQKDIEVKTKLDTTSDILISSEFQLAPGSGKKLELAVVSVTKDNDGISLCDLLLDIRHQIMARLADFTIVLRGLSTYGLDLRLVREYDVYRYFPYQLDIYDCLPPAFPKLIQSHLPSAISCVSYNVRISELNAFLLSSKNIMNGNK